MAVDMQRLRIERHVGEQHVVHLRHRARVAVLVSLADFKILEIESATLVPLDRFHHRGPPKFLAECAFANAIYHSFTIIPPESLPTARQNIRTGARRPCFRMLPPPTTRFFMTRPAALAALARYTESSRGYSIQLAMLRSRNAARPARKGPRNPPVPRLCHLP